MTWGQPFRLLDDTEPRAQFKQKPMLGTRTLGDLMHSCDANVTT
jgi:hypothetical protein